jgi:hypothetical protein
MSARERNFWHLLNISVRKLHNRLFIGGAAVLLFTIAHPAQGQTVDTQVTLSCNDGHSVIFQVDQITLTSLLADVQAINASGTGTICTLDTAAIDPSSESTEWTVYDYNPSNQAIAPRNSPNKMPATTPDGGMTWQFNFLPNTYTALFTTTDPSMTGNQSMTTLKDTITVSGPATTFMTQRAGGDCVHNVPAAVRFFFRSPSASGSSIPPPGPPVNGLPPAGFYTQFWWSNNAISIMQLLYGTQTQTITASMSDPTEWSDWDGKSAAAVPEAFLEATQNVQAIGLSFGGLCYFETGVTEYPPTTPPSYEIFSSQFSEN